MEYHDNLKFQARKAFSRMDIHFAGNKTGLKFISSLRDSQNLVLSQNVAIKHINWHFVIFIGDPFIFV